MSSFATMVLLLPLLMGSSTAIASSPIQKVLEMLEAAKAKTQADLDNESKAMEKYTQFCDDEASDKQYAIDTAARQLEDLNAGIQDAKATIASRSEEIGDVGSEIASLNEDVAQAKTERESEHASFASAEKGLLETIDILGKAIVAVEAAEEAIHAGEAVSDAPTDDAAAFLQVSSHAKYMNIPKSDLKSIVAMLSEIVKAEGIDDGSKATLQSFLQKPDNGAGDDDAEFSLVQQMMKPWKGKSTAGDETRDALKKAGVNNKKPKSLSGTLHGMQERSEERVAKMREKEMKNKMSFEMVSQRLNQELARNTEKLSTATEDKSVTTQELENANAKSGDVKASKAADEELRSTLAMECQAKAVEWEERMRSARAEMGAIDMASDVLKSGVKVLLQVGVSTRRAHRFAELQESSGETSLRQKLRDVLTAVAQKSKSLRLSQLAAAATNDPFVKVRGLINDMMAKLERKAAEAATKEAFCQEEIGKSKKSQADKTADADKHKSRMDVSATTIAELTQSIQKLTAELAEIDSSQAEATELRREEHEEYLQASSDQKQSADATAKAIDVLKSYYSEAAGAALLQGKSKQPSFGGKQGDAGAGIISLLEVAQDDFTKMLSETEGAESEAAAAYKKLTNENEIGKATKTAEMNGKASEAKTLKVQLSHSTQDYESVAKELDTVTGYLDKLKPQCAGASLSYAEKKAAREAEIAGLKEALEILDGEGLALIQSGRRLRRVQ